MSNIVVPLTPSKTAVSMESLPILTTQRLLLRPFNGNDVAVLQALMQDPLIAQTSYVPNLSSEALINQWIKLHRRDFRMKKGMSLAVVDKNSQQLMGAVSLNHINQHHRCAEIGYWLESSYWQQGYASEAVRCLYQYAFNILQLNRIEGCCLTRNVASAKVMLKAGARYEGEAIDKIFYRDKFENIQYFAITRAMLTHCDM